MCVYVSIVKYIPEIVYALDVLFSFVMCSHQSSGPVSLRITSLTRWENDFDQNGEMNHLNKKNVLAK